MIEGLLGRKLGMIQVFDTEGRMRGATVVEAGPCLITQIRTATRDSYEAVQLGFGSAKRRNKPMRGHLGRQGDLRHLREFNIHDADRHKVGDRIGAEIFQQGDLIDVTGVSKGHGFAGVVKRYNFRGGPKTHGQSDRHRARGSIGAGGPGRVFKGMRMAGHMGARQITVRGLEVIESNPARGMLLIAGSVPGARNCLLKIRFSKKSLEEARTRKPQEVEEAAPAAEEEETPTAQAEQDAPAAEVEETAAEDGAEAKNDTAGGDASHDEASDENATSDEEEKS